jgi:hypothetical protein
MMSSLKQLVCPVSNEKIDEHVTRLNALLVILMVIAGFLFNSVIFPVFLAADFFIRGFTRIKFSPLSYLSNLMANALQLDKKTIDKAPKIFAARIGFAFSLAISILFLLNLSTAALITGGVLVFFASLELALAFCMGCIMYTYLVLPFYK